MMAAKALEHAIFVTGGVIEEAEDGLLYNSMPIYGPDGKLRANYRKVHLSRYSSRRVTSHLLSDACDLLSV